MPGAQRTDEDRAADHIRRFERAERDRGNWEAQWEEIAQRMLPSYAHSFTNKGLSLTTQGDKRTEEMIDPTAALALPKFAAAMESMLTPRGSTWHRVVPMDKALMRNRQARMWYDDLNETLFRYRYAPRANYASQQHECYMGLGAFGTGAKFLDALDKRHGGGLRYRAIHLAEVYFLENHQGIIDTAFRRFPLTARQAVQRFTLPDGSTKLPEKIQLDAKDTAKCETIHYFVHAVMPREDAEYRPGDVTVAGMAYASDYVSVTGKTMVQRGGYNSFPYTISRYVVAPGETYGRSPAMLALPAIKVLNEEKKTFLKQGHRTVDPVLLTHDDDVLDGFSLKPGAMNSGGVTADGKLLVHALPTGNLSLNEKMMEMERLAINDAFLVTLFQILVDHPEMTATEVLERSREKGALLSPTMGRQQTEDLGPGIEREIDVLGAQGLLPPMPMIVKQMRAEYDVIYDSPLSRAQRAEQASGFMRWIDWTREYVTLTEDRAPLDWANWDDAMPVLADINAVPAAWVASLDQVAAKRAGRAKQAEMQQMIDAAPAAAGLMKSMPKGMPGG